MQTMPLKSHYIDIEGVNIHYVSDEPCANENTNTVATLVFLHGFPEYWQAWQHQLNYFSNNYRVIAPDLPGYNLSDKPNDVNFYQVPHLIAFISKFIAAVSQNQKVFLVAHDWGGAIAWPLAAFYPQYIDKLVILNAAHPSTFTREMINNPLQRSKSDYIHQLIDLNAKDLLQQNNYQYLCEKMTFSDGSSVLNDKNKTLYINVWQQTGVINGMLQYYRAMPQLASKNEKNSNEQVKQVTEMKIPNIRVHVPTLILWGEQDEAFVVENLDDLEQYVPNCTIKRFQDASHWLMHEKSTEINYAIEGFIYA
ncbi:alpha/beta hydrolase [Colwellia sp. Arc7-D]|uniref:alpha/beta fold hydrolase n=1 Tax=Colwellia sp. Arc7-D TaxID=2161872 RepID=UPI0026924D38